MRLIKVFVITLALTFVMQVAYDYKKPAINSWVKKQTRAATMINFRIRYSDIYRM